MLLSTPGTVRTDDRVPVTRATVARWLAAHELPSTVYAFPPLGVQPLRAGYRYLIEHLGIDAVVLADGGTDVLLRGDESDLGTPVEDITSLAAVAALDVRTAAVRSEAQRGRSGYVIKRGR
jgi:hypothetical protein